MTEHTTGLSPEARSLIQRTYEWLQPKGRWTKNAYAVIRGDDDHILAVEEEEYYLIGKGWQDFEEEVWDDDYQSVLQYTTPYAHVKEPDQACLVGGLIINNDYTKDHVYEEAVVWLAQLVEKTKPAENERRPAYAEPEEKVITFNDRSPDRRRVLSLLKRAFTRR